MNIPSGTFWRSRAMPMQKDKDNGSEKDGSRSDRHSCYCYHGGKFINPGNRLEEIIEFLFSENG